MREIENKYAAKKARYLALVRATRPFHRTAKQEAEINQARFEMDAAHDWMHSEMREALDREFIRRNQNARNS